MIRAMLIIGGAALIVGLTLYTLLDAVRTPAHEARTLPKWLWVLVTLLFPVVAAHVAYPGRPKAQPAAGAPRPGFGQRRSTPAPSVSSPTTMKSTCAGSRQKQNANAAAAKQNPRTNKTPRTTLLVKAAGRTSQDS